MVKKRQIPPVERVQDDQARAALSALKERVEDMDDIRGSRQTSAATVQDLLDAGLVEIDSRGILSKKVEDEQVDFKDQTLFTLETSLTAITTADLPDPDLGLWSNAKQTAQNQLINECKATINDLIAELRTGLIGR